MKKNSSFYTEEENKDFELLELFNNKLKLTELGKAPSKHYYDASGYTSTLQYVEMELKNRNGEFIDSNSVRMYTAKTNKPYTATTIYIEPQHYSRMKDDSEWNKNIVPLYINFLNDNTTLVWKLNALKKKPEWKWVTHIWDEGKREYKDEWRILLPINEAYIYQNNELKCKPNDK